MNKLFSFTKTLSAIVLSTAVILVPGISQARDHQGDRHEYHSERAHVNTHNPYKYNKRARKENHDHGNKKHHDYAYRDHKYRDHGYKYSNRGHKHSHRHHKKHGYYAYRNHKHHAYDRHYISKKHLFPKHIAALQKNGVFIYLSD